MRKLSQAWQRANYGQPAPGPSWYRHVGAPTSTNSHDSTEEKPHQETQNIKRTGLEESFIHLTQGVNPEVTQDHRLDINRATAPYTPKS